MKTVIVFLIFVFLSVAAPLNFIRAQTGGGYDLSHSVIASGGGSSSTGGNFTVDGTIGQTLAGTNSSGGDYSARGGFWAFQALAPTAASVSVGGRVLTADGRGIRNVQVTLTALSGESRTVMSGAFGYYRFTEVAAGETYIFSILSKRYRFAPQVLTVNEELAELNFTAER